MSVHDEVTYRRTAMNALSHEFACHRVIVQGVERCGTAVHVYFQLNVESLSNEPGFWLLDTRTGETTTIGEFFGMSADAPWGPMHSEVLKRCPGGSL